MQVPPSGRTANVSPLLPVDYDYPQALFFIDGPLIRLAYSNKSAGLSLQPADKSVVSNSVVIKNILDRWRRVQIPLPAIPNSPPDAILPPGAGTNDKATKQPIIDLPLNVTYLPVNREYQQCHYKVNPSGHKYVLLLLCISFHFITVNDKIYLPVLNFLFQCLRNPVLAFVRQ